MASKNQKMVLKKQKGEETTSKTGKEVKRPALDDISNLVPVDGKPINRPITRGYVKLLADAQAAAAVPATKDTRNAGKQKVQEKEDKKNAGKQKVQEKEINKQAVPKWVISRPVTLKPANLPKEDDVIITGSDSNKIPKSKSARRRSLHTLTYVLSTRSKDACGISEGTDEIIEDIDAGRSDQFDVVEYVGDLYIYYKQVEDIYWPSDYMSFQIGINPKMREILMGWIIELHQLFELRPETLYLTIYIIDRYLSLECKIVQKREMQLIGLCSILIASKYKEIWSPMVSDLINASKNAYTREEVLEKEKQIINKLGWYLTVPTHYMFLVRFIKTANDDNELANMIYFFADLAVMNYSLIKYVPSLVVASCVYAARGTLSKKPIWNRSLTYYTGYSEPHLWQCARILLISHSDASEGQFSAVYSKYSKNRFGKVSLRSLFLSA